MKIHGLSQEYWRKKIIFAIASSVGTPIYVDSVTSKPAHERTFGHFARVLVDIDLTKELKYEVLVERKGYAFFVEFEYENLPEFCHYCKIVGHNIAVCRKMKKNEEGNVDNAALKASRKENTSRAAKDTDNVQVRNNTWTVKKSLAIDLDPGTSSPHNDNIGSDLEVDNTQLVDNIDTDKDKNIDEGNQVVSHDSADDHSSQDSEFVEATDFNNDEEEQGSSQNQQIPTRVQNDMQFLHQSRANLAETDVETIRQQDAELAVRLAKEAEIDVQIQTEAQANIDASGFQVVTSKSSKKKKQNVSSSKTSDSYLTRSKVPNKPFR